MDQSDPLRNYLEVQGYRETSIKTILQGVTRLLKALGHDRLKQVEEVKKFIASLDKPSVKPALVHNLILYWRARGSDQQADELEPVYQHYKQEAMRATHHRLPKSVESFISLAELQTISQKLRTGTVGLKTGNERASGQQLQAWIKYLVVMLYAYVVPVRMEEYRTMIIRGGTKSVDELAEWATEHQCNVLSLELGVMVSSYYKTSARHQTKVIYLDDEVVTELQRWVTWRRQGGWMTDQHLLITTQQQPWKATSLIMLVKRTLGRGITVNYLRKSVIADLLHYWKQLELAGEIERSVVLAYRHTLARLMGHQYQTQELVYAGYQFMLNQGQWSPPAVVESWIKDNLDR